MSSGSHKAHAMFADGFMCGFEFYDGASFSFFLLKWNECTGVHYFSVTLLIFPSLPYSLFALHVPLREWFWRISLNGRLSRSEIREISPGTIFEVATAKGKKLQNWRRSQRSWSLHRYLYHCHRQQFGYEVSVEVMEEAQFPVSTNRCRSMRSLTIAETRPGA